MTKEKAEQIFEQLLVDMRSIEGDKSRFEHCLDAILEDTYQTIIIKDHEITSEDGIYEGYDIGSVIMPHHIKSVKFIDTELAFLSDKRIFNLEEIIEKRLEKDFGFITAQCEDYVKGDLERLYSMIVEGITTVFHKHSKYEKYFFTYEGDLKWVFGNRIS